MEITRDQQTLNVELPTDLLAGRAMVNGMEVPSVAIREGIIDGLGEDELARLAADAAIFSFERKKVVVVTTKHPLSGDEVLRKGYLATPPMSEDGEAPQFGRQGEPFFILRREEDVRIRPWNIGTMARFEFEPTPEALITLLMVMKEAHRVVVAAVDRKYFFVKTENRDRVFQHFGIGERVDDNAHLLVRMGVLMKRPGGLLQKMQTPSGRFSEDDNDGTIMITDSVDGPRPGTMRIMHEGQAMYLKGMVRPPFKLGYKTEPLCLVGDAQFGLKVPDGELHGDFAAVRTLPPERASLNYQAVLFGAVNPERVINQDNKRLRKMRIEDLFSPEERLKIRAGVPPALFMRQYSPWKWLTQVAVTGGRATVYGSDMVPVGSVRLLPKTYARFGKRVYEPPVVEGDEGKWKVVYPQTIILHRDPAVPDASSMSEYNLLGSIEWANGAEDEGIVLNPRDPAWKRAGGDFDGDAAVAMLSKFKLKRTLDALPALRRNTPVGVASFEGEKSFDATLLAMADGFTSRLGPAVMSAMRITEVGKLREDVALVAQQVIQASVDAKKHHVDTKKGMAQYQALRAEEEAHMPENGYLLTMMHKVRTASGEAIPDEHGVIQRRGGDNEKVKAWNKLVNAVKTRTPNTPVEKAMMERVLILDDMFRETQWLMGDRVELPSSMRTNANVWLLQREHPDLEMQLVRRLAFEYRLAARVYGDSTTDDDGRLRAQQALQETRLAIRVALRNDEISEAALIAHAPHRIAAELVSASSFQKLGEMQRHLETVLFGTEWADGIYKSTDLDPVKSAQTVVGNALDGVDEVNLKVIRPGEKYVKVLLTW